MRTARFIAHKNWIVTGCDDLTVRVFHVDTSALVASFKAHDDYVRYIDVHPTKSFILTSGDDKTIKLWDWDREWTCVQVFEGHEHYVMQAKFNPKDPNAIVSASLDRSVRVWSLTGKPTLELKGHDHGVNCVDFFEGAADGKSYVVSGSDDCTVKVWDLAAGAVVKTLVGHTKNVSAVIKHPLLPLIVTASEDDTVRTWDATTFRAESVLSFDLCRAWCLSASPHSRSVAIGYDHGSVVTDLDAASVGRASGSDGSDSVAIRSATVADPRPARL